MVISCLFVHVARLTEEIFQRNFRDELGATEMSLRFPSKLRGYEAVHCLLSGGLLI